MASRTKQKEEARARRLAEEQERQVRQRSQRRLRMVLGVVLAAIAVVAVAVVISTGGGANSSATGLQNGTKASSTVDQVSSLLNGIPQSGAVLGNPSAPVTMTYYGDLECPVCQDFTLHGGFSELVSKDVRQGKVKVLYRAFQTATRDLSTFQTQQVAALSAGQQKLFWNYVELFYHEQGQEDTGYVTENYLDGLAKQVPGLNYTQWHTARNNPALLAQVQADGAAGQAAGVQGTPTLIFQGPKGKASPSSSVPSYSDLENAVHSVS